MRLKEKELRGVQVELEKTRSLIEDLRGKLPHSEKEMDKLNRDTEKRFRYCWSFEYFTNKHNFAFVMFLFLPRTSQWIALSLES